MKVSKLFLLATLSVVLDLLSQIPATAQTFTLLYKFSAFTNASGANSDGASPASLILSGDKLYGTGWLGGAMANGDLFRINTDGSGFTNLHSFGFSDFDANGNLTNVDGLDPELLVLSGGTLYGVAGDGGVNGNGTIFKINTNGTGFTVLHTFAASTLDEFGNPTGTNADGEIPSSLMLLASTLYGAALTGGTSAAGTLFALSTNGGPSFSVLADFGGDIQVLSGNAFYGTSSSGPSGSIFRINTNGTALSIVYPFSALSPNTNSDGSQPNSLMLIGNRLYGTTGGGGSGGQGVIFSVNTNGMSFTNYHSFAPQVSNSDGTFPRALVLSGSSLSGPASGGGTNGSGTLFQINTNGSAFTVLYTFSTHVQIIATNGLVLSTNSDGVGPLGLVQSGNTIYGVAEQGGPSGDGTIFSLSLPPPTPIPLYIQASGNSAILTWSNAAFSLQAAAALPGTFTNIPASASPYTNPLTPPQGFFRLIH